MLPKPSAGAILAARVEAGRWTGELSGKLLAPTWAHPETSARIGGDVSWMGVEVAGCSAPFRWDRLAGCLGVEAGELTGKGRGEGVDGKTGRALWLAGTFGLVVRSPISSRFAVDTRLALAVPVLRPRFGFDDHEPFFQPDGLSGRAMIGIAWR
jgi:hypothetical protein